MKQLVIKRLVFLLIALLLSACGSVVTQPEKSGEITLVDGLGRTVTLPSPAQRIVTLAPSLSEVLFAVGAGPQLVGRHSFASYPEEVQAVVDIGGSMGTYSIETITSLQPDLVIAAEINTPEQVKTLEDLGLRVFYLSNPDDLDGLYGMLETVGELTGHEAEVKQLNVSLKERVKKVLRLVEKAETVPLVFYELDGTDPARPWTSGPGTFLDELILIAGGKNVGSALTGEWAQISTEELLVQNPDIILLGDSIYGMTPEQVATRTGWDGLKAVKEGRVYAFNDDLVSLPGPRLVDGLEELARMLHPELFK